MGRDSGILTNNIAKNLKFYFAYRSGHVNRHCFPKKLNCTGNLWLPLFKDVPIFDQDDQRSPLPLNCLLYNKNLSAARTRTAATLPRMVRMTRMIRITLRFWARFLRCASRFLTSIRRLTSSTCTIAWRTSDLWFA